MLTMTDPLHAMTLQGKLRATKQLLHFLILNSSYYFTTTYIFQDFQNLVFLGGFGE